MKTALGLTVALLLTPLAGSAGDPWHPSKYGASDTLGAINNLTPEVTTRPPAPDWAGFALPGT
ncbi:MAG: hypothetical protein OXH37_11250, partial [Gammaproteobacteria bacterium]|nr:hypothetical protein [Gammaproteobacteria bacterium]